MIVQIIGWFSIVVGVLLCANTFNPNMSNDEQQTCMMCTALFLICAAICFK